jgi:hypothetical protein
MSVACHADPKGAPYLTPEQCCLVRFSAMNAKVDSSFSAEAVSLQATCRKSLPCLVSSQFFSWASHTSFPALPWESTAFSRHLSRHVSIRTVNDIKVCFMCAQWKQKLLRNKCLTACNAQNSLEITLKLLNMLKLDGR